MTRFLIRAAAIALVSVPAWSVQPEIPAGTRFMVELGKTLEARKTKPGKRFEARTLEALKASGGSRIPAGAKLMD